MHPPPPPKSEKSQRFLALPVEVQVEVLRDEMAELATFGGMPYHESDEAMGMIMRACMWTLAFLLFPFPKKKKKGGGEMEKEKKKGKKKNGNTKEHLSTSAERLAVDHTQQPKKSRPLKY